jgi:hypothetical protein
VRPATSCTQNPPADGPPSCVAACVADVRLLRACSCSGSTISGRNVALATSKITFAKLTTSATTTSCVTLSQPNHQPTGTDPTAAARTRSAPICAPRNGSRCTSTPAGSPITSQAT